MKAFATFALATTVAAVCSVPLAAQKAPDLNARVSIDHREAKAEEVLRSLANAASLKLEMITEELSPVNITLTNVRVRTALDAVCENAGCKWAIDDKNPGVLKVTRTRGTSGFELKSNVSVHLDSAAFEQAFRTLASFLQVAIVFEGKLPVYSVTLEMKGMPTSQLLDGLCKAAKCTWRFEPEHKRLVISSK